MVFLNPIYNNHRNKIFIHAFVNIEIVFTYRKEWDEIAGNNTKTNKKRVEGSRGANIFLKNNIVRRVKEKKVALDYT